MDKIEEYLKQHLPRARKMGSSGLYEVFSDVNPSIAMVGKAGLHKLKDSLLMYGLKLTAEEEVGTRGEENRSGAESSAHRT